MADDHGDDLALALNDLIRNHLKPYSERGYVPIAGFEELSRALARVLREAGMSEQTLAAVLTTLINQAMRDPISTSPAEDLWLRVVCESFGFDIVSTPPDVYSVVPRSKH